MLLLTRERLDQADGGRPTTHQSPRVQGDLRGHLNQLELRCVRTDAPTDRHPVVISTPAQTQDCYSVLCLSPSFQS